MFWTLSLAAVAVAGWIRFSYLTTIGMSGHDNFQYYEFARALYEGDPVLAFYRPLVYAVYALSFHLFGFTDYGPRLMLNLFDMANIGLAFYLGWLVLRHRWAALAAGVLYAFSPMVLRLTKTELCHTFSTTFLLGFGIFFLLYLRDRGEAEGRDRRNLFLTGLMISLAAHTHEELGVFMALVPFFLFFDRRWSGTNKGESIWAGGRAVFRPFLWVLLGAALPALFFALLLGPRAVIRSLHESRRAHATGLRIGVAVNLAVIFHTFLVSNLGFLAYGFYGVLADALVRLKFRMGLIWSESRAASLCLLVPLFYLTFYGLLIGDRALDRLFSPLIPFCYLAILATLARLLGRIRLGKASPYLLCGLAAGAFYVNEPLRFLDDRPSYHRRIFDSLEGKVNPSNRLLVPAGFEGRWDMWGLEGHYGVMGVMYFGDNALTLFKAYEEGRIEEILQRNQVRYVFVTDRVRGALPRDAEGYLSGVFGRRPDLGGKSREDLVLLEREYLLEVLERHGATVHEKLSGLGTIYRLP